MSTNCGLTSRTSVGLGLPTPSYRKGPTVALLWTLSRVIQSPEQRRGDLLDELWPGGPAGFRYRPSATCSPSQAGGRVGRRKVRSWHYEY
jgi:hypothetical protein